MGKNRDKVSIIAAILEAAGSGCSKTRIMFGANLSFSLLEKYLEVAVCSGFLQVEDCKYYLNERGKEFLKEYKQFYERYHQAQKMMESLGSERERLARLCEKYGWDNSLVTILDSE